MILALRNSHRENISKVTSWMLHPTPSDEKKRAASRNELALIRLLYATDTAESPQKPPPFVWKGEPPGELTLHPNMQGTNDEITFDYLGSPDIIKTLIKMVRLGTLLHHNEKKAFDRAFLMGFTAGCIMLCMFVYDSNAALGKKSSKAQGESATCKVTGLGERTVQEYFREYRAVAHLWAAYIACSPELFQGIATSFITETQQKKWTSDYLSRKLTFDFLDPVDWPTFRSSAALFLKYGKGKNTSVTRLLSSKDALDIGVDKFAKDVMRISPALLTSILQLYTPGKRG